MKYMSLSIVAIILASTILQPVTFAAYGWWWSSVSTSNKFLSRDVCPAGDSSSSYYDGTCSSPSLEPENQIVFSTQEYRPAKEQVTGILSPEDELDTWIVERKIALEKALDKNEQKVLNMPIRYRMVQKEVDTIMSRWGDLDETVRHIKSVKLINKIDLIITSKKLSPKLLTIIKYIQDKAVLMTSFTASST